MKYSIVATVYNDDKEIDKLFYDIENQQVKPSEVIISDGGSTDGTVDSIRDWCKRVEFNVTIVENGRLSISEGLNLAIRKCKEEYIGILATGNRYPRNFFKKLLQTLLDKKCDIAYGPVFGSNDNNFSRAYSRTFLPWNGDYGVSNHGCLIKRHVFYRIGLYSEGFVYAGEDAEFRDRCFKYGIRMACAFGTSVLWYVPKNIGEFIKQRKLYQIAEMQIYGRSIYKKFFKDKRVVCKLKYVPIYGLFGYGLYVLKKFICLYCLIRYTKYTNENWGISYIHF